MRFILSLKTICLIDFHYWKSIIIAIIIGKLSKRLELVLFVCKLYKAMYRLEVIENNGKLSKFAYIRKHSI